jgi:signal transduction histidine kinase
MAALLLQFVCAALLALGLFFIGIEWRTRHDRSNLYFGVCLLVLGCLAATEIGVQAHFSSSFSLFWIRSQHQLGIAFGVFLNLYIMRMADSKRPRFVKILIVYSVLVGALFFTPLLLTLESGQVISKWEYPLIVGPYLAFVLGSALKWLTLQLKVSAPSNRFVIRLHFAAILGLILSVLLDSISIAAHLRFFDESIPSFTVIGVLAYGACSSAIFAERFFQLMREKAAVYTKLEAAYSDLESANQLRQVGESTAMINHEIKNYMFIISGNAQILQEFETLTPKGKSFVDNIISAVDRLTRFSKEILELSHTHKLKDSQPLNFSDLVRRTCLIHFADKKEFLLLRLDAGISIAGDPGKLEQLLVNLIQNAFEATRPGELPDLRLTLRSNQDVALLTIEDHGCGCNEENLPNLFKAFHTTKRGRGGNGLGMSLSRTLVESHGGKVSAYSKNWSSEAEHGLVITISLPLIKTDFENHSDEIAIEKKPFILLTEGFEDLDGLLRILTNAAITPYIVTSLAEMQNGGMTLTGAVLILSSHCKSLTSLKPQLWKQVALITSEHSQLYVTGEILSGRTELLTENMIFDLVLGKTPSGNAKVIAPKSVAA